MYHIHTHTYELELHARVSWNGHYDFILASSQYKISLTAYL